jgi:hypothetical protein
MSDAVAKNTVVVVTAPRPVTKEQRTAIKAGVRAEFPPGAVVIVLDPGMTIDVIPSAGAGKMAACEPLGDETPRQILAELQALRAELTAEREAHKAGLALMLSE